MGIGRTVRADTSRLLKSKDPIEDDQPGFWEGATFLPLDRPSRSDALLEKVYRSHQAAFVAFSLKLSATEPELYLQTGVSECLEKFKQLSADERQRLIEHPPFLIWLKLILSSGSSRDDLKRRLPELKRIMGSFAKERDDRSALTTSEAQAQLARFDVDPLIREAALPEYSFPDRDRQREFEDMVVYPMSFFAEMVTIAVKRIERAWPAAQRDFFKFVKLIVDMVDADFTSYSGYNHAGVIFVSTDNSSLVALEEYLIHELGHQILYNVMELDPLVINEPERMFRLPWSGQERDLCGYFHAFYIYTFMVHYLRRVEGRSKREQRRISDRLSHVLKGLDRATDDLEALDRFTPRGRRLFENLKQSLSGFSKV